LLQAVATQPVLVDVDASSHEFQLYESGVFTRPCGINPNHVFTTVRMERVKVVPSTGQ